ncbi:MAG: ABC transporter ATP-binding protein [Cellulosilyticum sp.]|nr:ABC transporter ATP-binding protein [Cellulosilyticum sp.]
MRRMLHYILKYKLLLVIGTLCMLIVIGIDQISPLLQMALVDKVIGEGEVGLFPTLILTMCILTIFKSTLGFCKEFIYDHMGTKVHRDLKYEVFQHMETFEFTYYDDMNTGELMSRINEDLENIWQTINFGLRLFIENIFYFLFSTIIIFILDWRLATLSLLMMVPIYFITMNVEKHFGRIYGELSDQKAVINTTAQEDIAGIRLVKAFAREPFEISRFLKLNQKYCDTNMELAHVTARHFPAIDFCTNVASITMIIGGGVLILNDSLSMGTLVAFSNYIYNLIWPMRQLGWLSNMLSRNKASAQKIFDILDREPKIQSPTEPYIPESIKGDIEFKHVSFKYKDEVVLKDINLHIPAGSKVAIMGTTGSGKSSLISLIGRYYDIYEGELLIDGVDVRAYDLSTLRQQMSMVFQDTFLFSNTIADNIRFSHPNASPGEIEGVCQTACIAPFIEQLEKQYDTEIGERGLGLSGGQKQRLSIARGLLRKAPIFVLDDATSALDMETEHDLITALNHLDFPCTRLMIGHRISAVKDADLIVYLENGEIKEQGTHESLLKKQGQYYQIFLEQYKDFYTLQKGGISLEKTS